MIKSLWIDCPPQTVCKESYFDKLNELNIEHISIMASPRKRQPLSRWKLQQLKYLKQQCDGRKITCGVTLWPYPRPYSVNRNLRAIKPWLEIGAIQRIEFDLECNWKKKHCARSNGLQDMAFYLSDKLLSVCKENPNIIIESTSFPEHQEFTAKSTFAKFSDQLNVQAYSISTRRPMRPRYHPGNYQRYSIFKAKSLCVDKQKVGVGLPLFGQKWDYMTPGDSLSMALIECANQNIDEIRFWSSKHLLGRRKKRYAMKFMETLQKTLVLV